VRFRQRFPGILPYKQASEPFRRSVFLRHWDGISRSRLAARESIGSATVERWFQDFLRREQAKLQSAGCPEVLGIDEHFFTRRHGYATTFCDLKNHRVYDVVLGRSQAALESYLAHLPGKERVHLVCMDLSSELSRAGAEALSAGAHCGGPLPCHPGDQLAFYGLLAPTGSAGLTPPRPGAPHAAA
jgi:transposase